MPRDIALWGYGKNGVSTEALIDGHLGDEFRITAIFDARAGELRSATGRTILDPTRIAELYQEGLFEQVHITVFDPSAQSAMRKSLDSWGVPELGGMQDQLFWGVERFEHAPTSLALDQPGYELHVLRNMRMDIFPGAVTAFVYDASGHVVRDYWTNYQLHDIPHLALYAPHAESDAVRLPGAWCMLAKSYGTNYWHFTYETLDHVWLLERAGYRGNYLLHKSAFAGELLGLLGIDPGRVTWIEDLDSATPYEFETLVFTLLADDDRRNSAPVLLQMADHVINALPKADQPCPKRIFVKRVGTRKLRVSQRFLEKRGIETIVPEELSVAQQIRLFHQADLVLCPHGANSTNSLYMRPGAAFVETFPMGYVNPCCLETARVGGLRYFPVVETVEREPVATADDLRDYEVRSDLLDMVLSNAFDLLGQTRTEQR